MKKMNVQMIISRSGGCSLMMRGLLNDIEMKWEQVECLHKAYWQNVRHVQHLSWEVL